MTFKTILQLSIVTFFVMGSMSLAEAPYDDTSTATSVTVISQTNGSDFVTPMPTRVNTSSGYGYSVQQIRSMPMVARPDRPGHFFGNTVRALYRTRRGR